MGCEKCLHSRDDHDAAGNCLTCAKLGLRCSGVSATVTIHIAGGESLVEVSMPAATTANYAAMRCAESLGLDPEARDWFLYDPVTRRPLDEAGIMATYDDRVLRLAWTEERRGG